jgi:hypothetical protein
MTGDQRTEALALFRAELISHMGTLASITPPSDTGPRRG